jgi:hypothetical protein
MTRKNDVNAQIPGIIGLLGLGYNAHRAFWVHHGLLWAQFHKIIWAQVLPICLWGPGSWAHGVLQIQPHKKDSR